MNSETKPRSWARHWALAGDLGLRVDRVEAAAYTSPEVFEFEREKIFCRAWIPVAREEELSEPGSFIRREVATLAAEAVITRGKDSRITAFHNACLHRGSALVTECEGRTSAFVCPYHAWSYNLEGQLKGMPGKSYFPQVDPGSARLKPINVDTWNGFVFLNFAETPDQSLTDFLGEFGRRFDGLPFADYPHVVELVWEVPANWKTLMEASNEAYHVGSLHKATLGEMLTHPENPHNNGYDAVLEPPHASATIQANENYNPGQPVMRFVFETEAFRGQPGGASSGARPGATVESARSFLDHPAINRIGLPSMSAESVLLFPFTCLQMLANRYIWFQYWPIAADKTRFVLRVYVQAPPSNYREAFAMAHMAAYSRDIATEDACMTSLQQRGLSSGGVSEVVFGENEAILRYFHQMISDWLGGD